MSYLAGLMDLQVRFPNAANVVRERFAPLGTRTLRAPIALFSAILPVARRGNLQQIVDQLYALGIPVFVRRRPITCSGGRASNK